jgi:hypothetical protein
MAHSTPSTCRDTVGPLCRNRGPVFVLHWTTTSVPLATSEMLPHYSKNRSQATEDRFLSPGPVPVSTNSAAALMDGWTDVTLNGNSRHVTSRLPSYSTTT